MNSKRMIALATLVVIVAATGNAEDPAQLALRVSDAQKANLGALQHYTWSIDATLSQDGAVKAHVVSNDHFNEKGELVYEVEKSETSTKKKRGLRGQAQQSAMADMSEFLGHVMSLTASYAVMSKGEMVDFFDKATISEGTGDAVGTITAVGSNAGVPGDKVTKLIDAKTLFPRKITFEAVVDEVPISGEILYRPIEGGPNVPRMATINIPSENQVIEAEFTNYAKQL